MKKTGFTFIELTIVIAIIGILAAICIPFFYRILSGTHRHQIVTCYSGNTVLYEGESGFVLFENGGCNFQAGGNRYQCSACSQKQ